MPFVSRKQRAYLWANKPEVARKFEKDAPLPKRKRKRKRGALSKRV